jgi:pimeloyl-ACP methyl ester carboxylesterase
MSRYVADAIAVLDDIGAERATFVGYSFGARVGYAVAQAAPMRLAGLIALDSLPDPEMSPETVRGEAVAVLRRGTREVIAEFAAQEAEPTPAWMIEHLCTTDVLAFAGGMEAEATEPDLWRAASSLRVPTLLVMGVDNDEDWRALGHRLVDTLPNAELVTLDVAHLAAFHRTDLTLPSIRRFLERVSAGT